MSLSGASNHCPLAGVDGRSPSVFEPRSQRRSPRIQTALLPTCCSEQKRAGRDLNNLHVARCRSLVPSFKSLRLISLLTIVRRKTGRKGFEPRSERSSSLIQIFPPGSLTASLRSAVRCTGRKGFEPSTDGLRGRRSARLSYRPCVFSLRRGLYIRFLSVPEIRRMPDGRTEVSSRHDTQCSLVRLELTALSVEIFAAAKSAASTTDRLRRGRRRTRRSAVWPSRLRCCRSC